MSLVRIGTARCSLKRRSAGTAMVAAVDTVLMVATSSSAQTDNVGAVQAIKSATSSVENGRVFDMELDTEPRLVWDFDVASAGRDMDVRIDARSGKRVSVIRDRTPDDGMALLATAKVPAVNAARTATAAIRGATLHGPELDIDRGKIVWKSDLVSRQGIDYDVFVDAVTRRVLSKKIDD